MFDVITAIFAIILVAEITSVYFKRRSLEKAIQVAYTLHLENQEQIDWVNRFVNGTRDSVLPLKLLLVPLVLFLRKGKMSPHVVEIANTMHKNNKKDFPELIYQVRKVVFWTSPTLSIVLQVEILIISLLFRLFSLLFRNQPVIDNDKVLNTALGNA